MPRGGLRLRTSDGKLNQIGSRVQECRRRQSLEQDELCARISVATASEWNPAWQDISRIENGVRMVSDLEVLAMSQALECDPSWLLTGVVVSTAPNQNR